MIALGPLIIVWFKYGIGPNIMMAFAICFFPIVLTTARGLREVEPGRHVLTDGTEAVFVWPGMGRLLIDAIDGLEGVARLLVATDEGRRVFDENRQLRDVHFIAGSEDHMVHLE